MESHDEMPEAPIGLDQVELASLIAQERLTSPVAIGEPIEFDPEMYETQLSDEDIAASLGEEYTSNLNPDEINNLVAQERLTSPIPIGEPIEFDPEMYEPQLSNEDISKLIGDDDLG